MKKDNNLSEDEVIRDWTLSSSDRNLVGRINRNNRLWFAIQLFALKRYGRFLENPHELSIQVISYVSKQLGLPLTFTIEKPSRKATYIEHRKLIFKYLGFSNFDDATSKVLYSWTFNILNQGLVLIDQIYPQAEQFLIKNRVALPSSNQLRRFISSLCRQHQDTLFETIHSSLSQPFINFIDGLLMVKEDDSLFNQLKEYPENASISSLKLYLTRYERLCEVPLNEVIIENLSSDFINYLYHLGRYYPADKIKRLKLDKRYSLMAIFLRESKKTIIDYIIQQHDQYISDICRKCNHINEDQIRRYRYKHEKAIDKFIIIIDHILCQEVEQPFCLKELYEHSVTENNLKEARENVKFYQQITKFGYAGLLQNRYNSMRRYFADFIKIPFLSETENSELMAAIHLIRQVDDGIIKSLPNNAPQGFIDHKLKKALYHVDGNLKRNVWEMGVAIALRDALRSGDVYSLESKKHTSFWNLVYSKVEWEKAREETYNELSLNQNAQLAINNLKEFFHETAIFAQKKIGIDGFATIRKGKLKLNKPDKLIIPENVKALQKKITACLPKIKIEQLLLEVDHMTGFSRHFTPLHGQDSNPNCQPSGIMTHPFTKLIDPPWSKKWFLCCH